MRRRLLAKLGARIARDIRLRAYSHLHRLSLSFFTQKPTHAHPAQKRLGDFIETADRKNCPHARYSADLDSTVFLDGD